MQYDLDKLRQQEATFIEQVIYWQGMLDKKEGLAATVTEPGELQQARADVEAARVSLAHCEKVRQRTTNARMQAEEEDARRLARERDNPEPER